MKATSETTVGVIVGRFQVAELTDGHREILDHVLSQNHSMNIIFLGVPPKDVRCTKNNPIPYQARKAMLMEAYPDQFQEIGYIADTYTDEEWSKNLDEQILRVTEGNKDVVLYGSRDSFIAHYKGEFECVEYKQRVIHSGSYTRKTVGKLIGRTKDFRSGCIWATQNGWTVVYPTVDCAIFEDNSLTKLYMAKKAGEKLYRFPGGFMDFKDNSYEEAAIRESREETGMDCIILGYIGSEKIDDWRYRAEQESIMTNLFAMQKVGGVAQASDDITELHLVDLADLTSQDIMEGHRGLFAKVVAYVKAKKNIGWTDKTL